MVDLESDFVDFETIRTLIEIEDETLLETYLIEIFKDLTDRSTS